MLFRSIKPPQIGAVWTKFEKDVKSVFEEHYPL